MKKRKFWLPIAALVAALAVAVPAFAVKYGEPDDGEHPYVALLVFDNADGGVEWRCTGTLISPTVILTAGHCTELNAGARAYFDEHVTLASGYPLSGGVSGTAYAHPDYQGLILPNTHDVGVVVLDAPAPVPGPYPALAADGYLDDLAKARGTKSVDFEVVGYGLQSVKPVQSALRDRMKAWVQLVNLRSSLADGYNLHTTNAPGKGTGGGGTCFGDSGGAVFNEDHEIVAVNSFVLNENCQGASFGYRTDRQEVIDWVNGFLD